LNKSIEHLESKQIDFLVMGVIFPAEQLIIRRYCRYCRLSLYPVYLDIPALKHPCHSFDFVKRQIT
jgi:hypothetical protein